MNPLKQAALGRIPCTFALENVRFVNVFTGEVYPAAVYIHHDTIVHVAHGKQRADQLPAEEILDGNGAYLVPGFIDSHVHIESSTLTPPRFAEAVVPRGTTTAITDPHEIANVLGEDGVIYMHDVSQDLPMRQLINVPSCVPAVPGLEYAGAEFHADSIRRLSKLARVVGLAEVMDYLGVAEGEARMEEILSAACEAGLYLQGHIPSPSETALSAYRIGGPETCHESSSGEEALLKLRNGLFVDLRNSSIAETFRSVWSGVRNLPFRDRLSFCTDDREVDDLVREGHLDHALKQAVQCGMDGVEAVRMATLQAAREARVSHIGAIAPGYAADMLLLDDLVSFNVRKVWYGGTLVAKDGALIQPISYKPHPIERRNTVAVPPLESIDFRFCAQGEAARVRVLAFRGVDSSYTDCFEQTVPVRNGAIDIADDPDLAFALMINRYGRGTIGRALVRGYGLARGAHASTVSHDSHNLCIVYRDAESAKAAFSALSACGGGMCCVINGDTTLLELPVAGLMSARPMRAVADDANALKQALRRAGMPQKNPFMRIVTLALPVVPTAKLTDLGIVDTEKKELLPFLVARETR